MNTTETEAKHTEGTWTISPIRFYKDNGEAARYYASIFSHGIDGKKYVCDLDFGYGKKVDQANAAYILRACNNHEQLLEACKLAKNELQASGEWAHIKRDIANKITNAITKAERGAEEGGI